MTSKPGIPLNEPTTEAGRVTAGKACWALHAFTMEHNIDCTVFREGIFAIEREARGIPLIDVELLRQLGPPTDHCASDCCDAYPRLHVHGDHDEWNALLARLASESSPVEEGERPE